MATLGERFFELGSGYEVITESYSRPYLLGVDISEVSQPFVLASGDHHSDMNAVTISLDELLSGKWDEHIAKAQCTSFIHALKQAINQGESFPPKFLKDLVAGK